MPNARPAIAMRHLILAVAALSLPAAARAGEMNIAAAQADLAAGLLIDATGKDALRNLVYSPASAASALGVAAIGASPKASVAIAKSLGLEEAPDAAVRLLDESRKRLGTGAEGPAHLALRIVFDTSLRLKADAGKRLESHGIMHAVDRLTTADAVERINLWVKAETAGLIPTMLDAPPGEGFVALAALHFKGRWKTVFGKPAPGPFRTAAGDTVTVPIMALPAGLGRFRTDGRFAAADLPYAGGGYSMIVITARDDDGLTPADLPALAGWMAGEGFREQDGEVTMPTFSVEASGEITEALDKRGFGAARKAQNAFETFTDDAVVMTRVVQKTLVSVDEAGTEAASATAVIAERSVGKNAFVRVDADAPFLFCLRETSSGLILAAGIIADPAQALLRP